MIINFSFETKYGVYSDALHLPDDHTFSDADLEAMKQQRLNNWIAVIEAPPVEIPEEEITGELPVGAPVEEAAPESPPAQE